MSMGDGWPERMDDTPNIGDACFEPIDEEQLFPAERASHPPRILLLYGSLRKRAFSRLLAEEAARILRRFGAETMTFDPRACRYRTMPMATIRRSRNCGKRSSPARAWSGVPRSVMGP